MSAWMPIESAPIDGTTVIVYDGKNVLTAYGYVADGFDFWWDGYSQSMRVSPTHWMPLPEPPESPRYEITPEGRKALEGK